MLLRGPVKFKSMFGQETSNAKENLFNQQTVRAILRQSKARVLLYSSGRAKKPFDPAVFAMFDVSLAVNELITDQIRIVLLKDFCRTFFARF